METIKLPHEIKHQRLKATVLRAIKSSIQFLAFSAFVAMGAYTILGVLGIQ